jgi:hypothetical protein
MNNRWTFLGVGIVIGLAVGAWVGREAPSGFLPEGARAADAPRAVPPDDGKLRIICFGAHPDDCELQVGGMGALWARKGHHVKFVSVTNGDIGHWREAGGPLARRRRAEAQKADDLLRVTSEVLDIHDGELLPTQFYEGGANGSADLLPADPAAQKERHQKVRAGHADRSRALAQRFRGKLAEWYGKEQADKVAFAEAFEVCEYGRKPDKAELRKLFPVFPD